MGIVMLVLFALQCAYVYWVRDRIAFATAHVKAAVNAVEAHRAVYGVALALVFLQMAWVLVWELASLGVSSAVNSSAAAAAGASNATAAMGAPSNGGGSNGSSLGGAAVFGMTVSLYWGTQTFMYASHFIVASVVGSWWFTPKAASPVAAATHRAFTSSFGSLSFGALIVAVLEACKQLARAAQEAARKDDAPAPVKILACLCVCIVSCVEDLVKYFNSELRAGGRRAFCAERARLRVRAQAILMRNACTRTRARAHSRTRARACAHALLGCC
jgi:hypothetical protein